MTIPPQIDNSEDIIDSRDVIERIEWLTDTDDEDEKTELKILESLQNKGKDYELDWEYGCILIRNTYFKEYAQELAEDIGAIDANMQWPLSCIDWDQAAHELKLDYTCINFNGVDYWVR